MSKVSVLLHHRSVVTWCFAALLWGSSGRVLAQGGVESRIGASPGALTVASWSLGSLGALNQRISSGSFGPSSWSPTSETGVLSPLLALPSCERRTWPDKRRHFLLSMAFTGSAYVVARRGVKLSKGPALALSIGAVSALGLAKEIYDKKNGDPPCFSRLDLLANSLGTLTAAGVILIL